MAIAQSTCGRGKQMRIGQKQESGSVVERSTCQLALCWAGIPRERRQLRSAVERGGGGAEIVSYQELPILLILES